MVVQDDDAHHYSETEESCVLILKPRWILTSGRNRIWQVCTITAGRYYTSLLLGGPWWGRGGGRRKRREDKGERRGGEKERERGSICVNSSTTVIYMMWWRGGGRGVTWQSHDVMERCLSEPDQRSGHDAFSPKVEVERKWRERDREEEFIWCERIRHGHHSQAFPHHQYLILLIVSSPDRYPTLSWGETVWWTKSNFLGLHTLLRHALSLNIAPNPLKKGTDTQLEINFFLLL